MAAFPLHLVHDGGSNRPAGRDRRRTSARDGEVVHPGCGIEVWKRAAQDEREESAERCPGGLLFIFVLAPPGTDRAPGAHTPLMLLITACRYRRRFDDLAARR
jgi:hypothetical protein